MSWETLYPGCDVRYEDDRPFEVEWDLGKENLARATVCLLQAGFIVALRSPAASTSLPGEAARVSSLVISCSPAIGFRRRR